MSKEQLNVGPEQREFNTKEAGEKQHEIIKNKIEQESKEATHENDVESVRHEALNEATRAEKEQQKEEVALEKSPAERRVLGPNKAEEEVSFKATMKEVRSQMSVPSRTFSKVIHNKAVEKVSEGVGSTVARPNAILTGAIFAFALTLGVYLLAKNLGYPLSGFETIAAFILGWILGIVYDFLKVMVTGRR
jgi:uncharacterized membrane protein YdbT with pleckstrin-like domain